MIAPSPLDSPPEVPMPKIWSMPVQGLIVFTRLTALLERYGEKRDKERWRRDVSISVEPFCMDDESLAEVDNPGVHFYPEESEGLSRLGLSEEQITEAIIPKAIGVIAPARPAVAVWVEYPDGLSDKLGYEWDASPGWEARWTKEAEEAAARHEKRKKETAPK